MTNQEMFDTVAAHLLAQGKRSAVGLFCKYRGPAGSKCALGCLIPDARYSAHLEGQTAEDCEVQEAAGYTSEQYPLANELQVVHDSRDPLTWAAELTRVARLFNLKGLSND